MLDFEVQRCSRKCSSSGRELRPGETCYSVLVSEGSSVQRLDYSEEAWSGPPENSLGWWRSRIAEPGVVRMSWAPNDVLLDYFMKLADEPTKADERYVLALLLVRRRILRLEETSTGPDGNDVLTLFCPRHELTHQVVANLPDESRVRQIQEDLGRLLQAPGAAQAVAPDSSAAGAPPPLAPPTAGDAADTAPTPSA